MTFRLAQLSGLAILGTLALWACDDGATADPERCGNGVLEPENGEACDDGNAENGDGCSAECRSEAEGIDGAVVESPDDGGPDQGADAAATPDLGPAEPDGGPLEDLTLNSLIPNRGEATGGLQVRVIGTGFVEGVQFFFGDAPCEGVTIESRNHARCVVPPGVAGPIDVLAYHEIEGLDAPERRQDLLSEGFTYFDRVGIAGVQPDRSPVRGGIPLLIRGTGLIEGTQVEIGGQRLPNVTVNQDGTVSVFAPPGAVGPADVTVSNFNGRATLAGGLFYYEDLTLASIDPPVGPVAGGVPATLRGTGLTRATRVNFADGVAEVQSAADDRTGLDVIVPRGAGPGVVDVALSNDNGEVTAPGAYVYYDDAAVDFGVAGVAPNSGPVQGGNVVFVAGAGFSAGTVVVAGAREVPCEFVDAHRLRCTMPPGVVGPVDVTVTDGADTVTLVGGYNYFETLELVAIIPERGAVAGGTYVALSGAGFTPEMTVTLGGQELLDLVYVDETRVTGVAPPNTAGPVTVGVATRFSRANIPAGYTYFDPVTRFGGVWGDPIDHSVNVTVLNAGSGAPVDEAAVLLVANDEALRLEGLSNAVGQLTLSSPDLLAPANITAAKAGFEATTIEDVESENVTIYLVPNDGMGSPPPGVPAAILQGTASGLDLLPKPVNERYINVIVVETTHSSPYNRNRLPAPGPGGLLLEDGPFEIIARPGELAIVATAGELDRDALKQFQDNEIDYWTMRQSFNPLKMGLRRFVSASPGQTIGGLDVVVDHPMDLVIPVELDNPPLGADPGPNLYAVLPRINFGAEGYWEIDTVGVSLDPSMQLPNMPTLEGWDPDLTFYLIGLAISQTDTQLPQSVVIEETRDIDAGVFMTPVVGSPFFINPMGGPLGPDRLVTWGVHDGFNGPITPPHANMVFVEEPALGPPKPLWRYVTPSLITEVEVPILPEAAAGAGLGGGAMFLRIVPFIVDGPFNYDEFTYDDLNQARWKSWGMNQTVFSE